jgi:hypothetical protein
VALDGPRAVTEGEWLQVRLELLGVRLSYPSYRVELGLDADRRVAFTFMASAGMAEYLAKQDRGDTAKLLAYHAEGIGHQVEELLKESFPDLWRGFSAAEDLRGRFLVPGGQNQAPPRELASWAGNTLYWSP